ncbi:MAG TPA: T9SS type A sorting domain-containing protein [Chitinophagaceae bacterium]|jgi:outer membrane lipoprotein-sorting protein|nr:T9SS type A sorting domain-containing protein [Chitinophagaceae bacterium]
MQTKLFCIALITLAGTATAKTAASEETNQMRSIQNSFSDSVQIYSYPAKKNVVRLYPNPTSNGTITVNSNTNEPLHFYIFDLEGVLISRVHLKGKEHKTITGLTKGTFSYDVFKNDESIEQGKITVK